MVADHRIYIGDPHNTSPTTWYNITSFVSADPLDQDAKAEGQPDTLSFVVYSDVPGVGSLPVQPVGGMEVIFYDHNYYGTNLHRYNFAGKISTVAESGNIEGMVYQVQCEGFERELNTFVSYISFDADAQTTDQERINHLFATVAPGNGGPWDGTSNVGGPFIDYTGTGVISFYRRSMYDILIALATDPGPASDPDYPVPYRRWYVHGEWTTASTPGSSGNSITRYFNYYSGETLAHENVPLTDDSLATYEDYISDSFNRANAGTLGTADTGQTWSAINGTQWGITSNQADYMGGGSGVGAALINPGISDGFAQVTFAAIGDLPRLVFRATVGGTGGWQGMFVQATATTYDLQFYNGSTYTTLGSYSTTPAAGDVVRAAYLGSSITVYINGIQRITATSTSNQNATLVGISANSVDASRWENFTTGGTPAVYYDWQRDLDYVGVVNIIPISGPGSDPFFVEWDETTDVGVDTEAGRITKTATTSAWDAGVVSDHTFSSDGGYVTATIEDTVIASDTFARPDNSTTMGTAQVGGDWMPLSGTQGIIGETAYPLTFTSSESIATLDTAAPIAVVEAKLSTYGVGAGIVMRASDGDNLFAFVAEANGYKLYRRQAGTYTQIGSYLTTPASGDTIKVSIEDNVFKCYTNGTFRFQVTDTFNATAVEHGVRFFSSGSGARIDDFKVRVPYTTKAFGIGTTDSSQSYTDIEFGILINSDRTARAVESGTLVGTSVGYLTGDTFKVEVRPYIPSGQTTPVLQVKYYHIPGSTAAPSLMHTSTTNPNFTTSTYKVDTAFYHPGGVLTNITARLFSFAIYTKDDSIDAYGKFWAKEILSDDNLSTDTLRQARADAIFARYAYPRDTMVVKTFQAYHHGRTVLVNNSRLGWVNLKKVITEISVDWSDTGDLARPIYTLTLGDKPYEYGDEEPLGYLLYSPDDDRQEPPVPLGLQATTAYRDGPYTVAQTFTWQRPSQDEQWVEIALNRKNEDAPQETGFYRFPARQEEGTIAHLPPATLYEARIRARDYNNNVSGWSEAVPFTTISIGLPTAPAWAATPFPREGVRAGGIAWTDVDWAASTSPNPQAYILSYYSATSGVTAKKTLRVPGDQTMVTVEGLAPNVAYTFAIATIDAYGVQGNFGTDQSNTIEWKPQPLPNGALSFDVGHQDQPMQGWEALVTGVGTSASIATNHVYQGKASLKLTNPASTTNSYISPPFEVIQGRTYLARSFYFSDSVGTPVATFTDFIRWYDKNDALLSTSTVGSGVVSSTWTEFASGQVTAPAFAVYARRVFQSVTSTGTGTTDVYITSPDWSEVVGATQLAPSIVYTGLLTLSGSGRVGPNFQKIYFDANSLQVISTSTLDRNIVFKDNNFNTMGRLYAYDSGAGVKEIRLQTVTAASVDPTFRVTSSGGVIITASSFSADMTLSSGRDIFLASNNAVGITGATTVTGTLNISDNLGVSCLGADETTPRVFGLTDLTAARFQFGDEQNGFQCSWGKRVQLFGWWGIEVWGSHQGAPPLFAGGDTADQSLMVYTSDTGRGGIAVFGSGSSQTGHLLSMWLPSSTSTQRQVGSIQGYYESSTDASRRGGLKLYGTDATADREGMRIATDGSKPTIGFYGATAVAKQTVTGSRGGNAALADLLTKLANLGIIGDGTTA